MKILLVEAPFHSFMEYDRWYYPFGITQIAAVLHEEGHEVSIYDADRYFPKDPNTRNREVLMKKQMQYFDNVNNFDHYIWKHFKGVLAEFDPDIVGVSIYTCKYQSALNTLEIVRNFNKNIKTLVGGSHVTAIPETLITNENIDGVFCGFSDRTIPAWIKKKCPKEIVRQESEPLVYQDLPYVRRQSLMFPDHYTKKDLSFIMTSRGCQAKCSFCSNTLYWSGRPSFRTSESLEAELKELREEYDISDVFVGDAVFSDYHAESKRVADIIQENGMIWKTEVRWATINNNLIEHFIKRDCYHLSLGLESGSDKILKYIKKGCTTKHIRKQAAMLRELGIKWHLFCIIGFPIETKEDMQQTLDLAMEIQPTSISLNSLSPLPGTKIYNDIPWVTVDIAQSINQVHPNYCFSEYMDLDEFQLIFLKMLRIFDAHNKKMAKVYTEKETPVYYG